MTAQLYVLVDWPRFENSRTRSFRRMKAVVIPLDWLGWKKMRALARHRRAAELFGVYVLLCQVASSCHYRGLLLSPEDGPHDPESLAAKTQFPERVFERALPVLSEIGLIKSYFIVQTNQGWEIPPEVVDQWRKAIAARWKKAQLTASAPIAALPSNRLNGRQL